MDINKRFNDIREKRAELAKQIPSGFCLVLSLANNAKNTTAGQFYEVSTAKAAELLVDNTHRLATEAELGDFERMQDAERERLSKLNVENARRQFSALLGVPQNMGQFVPPAPAPAPAPGPVKPPVKQ